MRDLSHLVMSELEAQKLATIDPLTGALSRRGFRSEAERALGLAVRHNHPLSCIAIDLDHFKSVNDRYGHAAGDRLLMATAELCRDQMRTTDIFGRLGGEEFVILLPHTDLPGAIKVAESTRLALAARTNVGGLDECRATASFGITTHDASVATLDELLRRADEALYRAKEAGRNSCVAWRPAGSVATTGHMRRVLKAGQIVFNSGRSVIECTIRAISDTAASLQVISTADIPSTFKLAVLADGTSQVCKVSSKRDQFLEVAFN